MILTKQNIESIDIDFLVNEKLKSGEISEILFVVPTKRKIRYLTRELITLSPRKTASLLKIETLGSLAEKLLDDIDGKVDLISEEASVLLLNHSFKKVKLKYFSQYKEQIPFGTLERVKNVISEYKQHGITPERLKIEAENLSGSEKLKALDIANVFEEYQKSLNKNNFCETGDIYSKLLSQSKEIFSNSFSFLYPGIKYVLINGFDEFTAPEVEIIDSVSEAEGVESYIILDYYKYNPPVFGHLNNCYNRLVEKGFREIIDTSISEQNKFLKIVRENLSIKTLDKTDNRFQNKITLIEALSREEEVELIGKTIKKLLINERVEPERICIVFNLIGNYSTIIRDRFKLLGIPYNLTDRFSLSISSPVKALFGFLEILDNDYYYKNIFRALSTSFLNSLEVEISSLLKTSVELKIISGYANWLEKISAAIIDASSPDEEKNNHSRNAIIFKKAQEDLIKISAYLNPFIGRITPEDFRKKLLGLIFKLNFHKILVQAQPDIVENDAIAFNSFLRVLDEVTDLLVLEHGSDKKFPLHFYLTQLKTTAEFTRYNIPEKPGYGVQITTLNEIRGLDFDYLFIGGLNDGDLPTRFTPEIFFSGSFAREEIRHQTEQRYLFYQSLCVWKKKLYLSFPQTDQNRELVQSSFLKDFNSLFEMNRISKSDFKNELYSKEELLELVGKLSTDERHELKFPDEININLESINNSIQIDKQRLEDPFGESEYSGYLSGENISEIGSILRQKSEEEFSATQLETYGKCPYKYFVENILKLETIEEPVEELEAFEYGSLIHSILFEFYSKLKENKIILANCDDSVFKTAEQLLFKIAEKRFDELKLNPEYSFYEREKLLGINGRRNQSLLYKFLEEERKGGPGYVPEFFELSFGRLRNSQKSSSKINEAVSTDGIKLKGKIDRIDINEEEKTYKIIDYKLGGAKPTADDLVSGISLQLPLYLFAAKELIKRELEKDYHPTGAQIFSLMFNEVNFGKKNLSLKSRQPANPNLEEQISNTEEMIKVCLETVSKFTTDISNGKFHLTTLKNREAKVCKFCDFKRICRIQEVD